MAENFEKIKQSIIDLSKKKIEELLEKESKITETKFLEAKKKISSEIRANKKEIDKKIKTDTIKIISKLEIELNKSKREITEDLVNNLIKDIKADLNVDSEEAASYLKVFQGERSIEIQVKLRRSGPWNSSALQKLLRGSESKSSPKRRTSRIWPIESLNSLPGYGFILLTNAPLLAL